MKPKFEWLHFWFSLAAITQADQKTLILWLIEYEHIFTAAIPVNPYIMYITSRRENVSLMEISFDTT